MMRYAPILTVLFTLSTAAALPAGPAPAPLELPHFPSPVHALVFRNWNLVEPARLARVLATTEENVAALADSMGLPPPRPIPPRYRRRLYISLIKRNWHLLPYDQLLTLLDMDEARLAQALREDDFLWVKLGMLKPRCDRLIYAPPTDAQKQHAARIRAHLAKHFPDFKDPPAEAPLAFLDRLDRPIADDAVRPSRAPAGDLRFLYSYVAVYGDPLLDPSLNPLPDALLQRYADLGVTGVWIHTVLRDLAPPTAAFPEFGQGHETRLANLAKLVARARRFGIRIYLYLNEPRAMPAAFFDRPAPNRADLRGAREGDHFALCTSHPIVRQWLADSLSHLFRTIPDLGGAFTITASENFTHCASHGNARACPRCKDRSTATLIAELNSTIERAIHDAAPTADVVIWDWGWPDDAAADIIAHLPRRDRTAFMSVSEWALPIERGGVRSTVGEYSLSAIGPGPRALRHWALARARGLRTIAKVQANCTWELSALPYLPVPDRVARHAVNLARADVDGVMMSWTLGGYPSANLEVFNRLLRKQAPPMETVLDDLARHTFGPAGAPHARTAWSRYSQAFGEFPYSGAVVYNAPLQVGPANLLYPKATGYRATMVGLPYDDLAAWRGPYPADVFIEQMEKVAQGFAAAEQELEAAATRATGLPPGPDDAVHQLRLARAARLHFASVAAQSRFIELREALAKKELTPEAHRDCLTRLRDLVSAEADRAKALYPLQRQDSRIGFEASNHYYYLPQDLVEKHLNCERLLAELH